MRLLLSGFIILGTLAIAACGNNSNNTAATDSTAAKTADTAVAAIETNPLKNCYFGDLHLHTALSPDANIMGSTLMPEDSYKYALGETVTYLGNPVKRIAPLDFLAVTDHSEYLGVVDQVKDPNGLWAGTAMQRQWSSTNQDTIAKTFGQFIHGVKTNTPDTALNKKEAIIKGWDILQLAAAKYYRPGKFTTFVGYEWTSMPSAANGGSQNLHRCVIFKGDKVPELPFSSFDSNDPENLWTYLENARTAGSDVLAVPHNSNLSNGLMFDTKTLSGKPLTKEYAVRRMANEPLTEMAQGKGESETSPTLSPNDEFANYEVMETLLNSTIRGKTSSGSYVRQAWGTGQELQEKLGANPFKMGVEGGTDYHSGITTSEENNYPGSHATQDDLAKNFKELLVQKTSIGGEAPIKLSASSITGVWAESNTREAIFDALKRKECFATSGGRIKVRLFAGWNYNGEMTKQGDWVKQAYAGGVPMGADLPAGTGKPKFLVQALKDPNSGNLDRIQIIKVSTKNGKSTEKIYNVVWSGDRKVDAKGKLPAIGNTVDVAKATYTENIGSAELIGYWEDTDFDPQAYSTYYARVLEIPTPRWSTYLAAKHGLPVSKLVPTTIQERAWTSPVWYTPSK
ncbi:DUF3604 domain-containing protein [Flavihumibacter petaseus]|uniref:DUF3604 domain-containing protein n=1 Tax=Flavihumibacter petaseus NBRC 106054 TaxID=1220578 RepID=A0A0E9MZD7_9BACT|nr:DUF3604 domain-containing protein [Flavihumibacter petaseus]GAO42756.1 hypothetical protein FPE01S_01_17740 [Flavihumibacter petaseus NBRC 106054]